MEKVFIWAMCWSLGALLELEDRKKFNHKLKEVADKAQFPPVGDETAFEYFVNPEGQWQHWKTRVKDWHYPTDVDPSFGDLLLPTLDSLRYVDQLTMLVPAGKPVLFTGAPGVSKSATIQMFISGLDLDKWQKKMVPFSFVTSPEIFQRTLESCVEKRQGRTYGPPGGKKCAFFVDDISMPVINSWGDQITNEIVRQCLDENGCYNLDKAGEWRIFADMGYISAMVHPGGGRNDVPHRLKRQFNLINVTMPSLGAINNIFGSIMSGRLSTVSPFHAVSREVATAVSKLTEATIELWQRTSNKMLPTPAKFHYSWNMREISRVFGGMFMADRKVIVDEKYLVNLWRHECERVFTDKLTNAADKEWENKTILNVVEMVYGKDLAARVSGPCYFVNFLLDPVFDDDGVCVNERPQSYEFAQALDHVRAKSLAFQEKFNEENKVGKLELVLFEYALEHLMRISRCMCQDRGSMMLVGVGGSGKQSLTRLASFIAGNFIFQISITKYYSTSNLFEDIKLLYKTAGLKGKPVTFIFTDAEVKEEGFLEYINQILSTGEVSNLFPKDEIDAILGDLRPVAKKAKIEDTLENLTKFFFDRVRNMLHMVLCMSPVGDKLSSRSRKFPGLINCTTVDWFLAWPEEGLLNVSRKFITEFKMETTTESKTGLMAHMAKIHSLVTVATTEYFSSFRRNVYVTPKSYLSFLKTYCQVYSAQYNGIKTLSDKINNGLVKLEEAAKDVAKMQVELKQTEIVLQEASAKSAVLLKEITIGTAAAEKTKTEVKIVADMAGNKATVIGGEKAEVEKDLLAAKPALEEAESALDAIRASDIKDLAKLGKPPEVIKVIFDAVLILKHSPVLKCQMTDIKGIPMYVTNYSEAQSSRNSMMGDANAFVASLQNFPKENITDEDCELLAPYTESALFTVEMAAKASSLAIGLCKWARAMKTYHEIAKVVIPKMDALRVKEAELATANKQLAQAQALLASAQASLDEMQVKFDTAMAEKQKLQDDADNTKRKMSAANALISGLSGEKVRWTQQSKEFDDQIARLVGDCAIACAFLSYLGPFNKIFRDKLTKVAFTNDANERKVPGTKGLDIAGMLVDSATTGEWNLQGLPSDELSVQNGILTTRASRYPLMVDPQGQGLSWIRCKETVNCVKETSFQDKGFRVKLEQCMEGGLPLLLANVENELDPVLDPVLDKSFIKKGKNFIVALADKGKNRVSHLVVYCIFL
jgi:dynein heavy chain